MKKYSFVLTILLLVISLIIPHEILINANNIKNSNFNDHYDLLLEENDIENDILISEYYDQLLERDDIENDDLIDEHDDQLLEEVETDNKSLTGVYDLRHFSEKKRRRIKVNRHNVCIT